MIEVVKETEKSVERRDLGEEAEVSVVVPIEDESVRAAELVEAYTAELKRAGRPLEFIFVLESNTAEEFVSDRRRQHGAYQRK